MENNTKQISAAFVKAQKQFSPALKTAINPAFKNSNSGGRYADLSACVEAVIDALNNNGIGLLQQTHECESGVSVETVFLHESGEELRSGKLWLPASKQDAQGYGSALTYARRYSLMAACGIAPEDDDGNKAVQQRALPDKVLADFIAALQSSKDMQELETNYKNAYRAAQGANDQAAIETFAKLKDGLKNKFTKND